MPPGRAGRNWLRRRLAAAQRGREQPDRKLRVLFPELRRLSMQAARERTEWEAACGEARSWLSRAALLGGQDAIRGASRVAPVRVELQWTTAMGLTYPSDAQLSA